MAIKTSKDRKKKTKASNSSKSPATTGSRARNSSRKRLAAETTAIRGGRELTPISRAKLVDYAQARPVLFRTGANTLFGIFIESVSVLNKKLLISGWSIGSCELSIVASNETVATTISRHSRVDVAAEFGVAESEFGFTLSASVVRDARLLWVIHHGETGHPFLISLEAKSVAGDAELPAAGRSGLVHEAALSRNSEDQVEIVFDKFVGPIAYGWATKNDGPFPLEIIFGNKSLGKLEPSIERQDVRAARNSKASKVGFRSHLGGLLQFSALSEGCRHLELCGDSSPRKNLRVSLSQYYKEAVAYSPMRATRWIGAEWAGGQITSIKLSPRREASFLYETLDAGDNKNSVCIDFYQEESFGHILKLKRFCPEQNKRLDTFSFHLLNLDKPLLVVARSSSEAIVATDCIPFPKLFSDKHALLIEYHGRLAGGETAFKVARRLSFNYLKESLQAASKTNSKAKLPHRKNSSVIIYSGSSKDLILDGLRDDFSHISNYVIKLNMDGSAEDSTGGTIDLRDYVAKSSDAYFIFSEDCSSLRPDFWEIFNKVDYLLQADADLVYWDGIYFDGISRPVIVKHRFLLNKVFQSHNLLDGGSFIIKRSCLLKALSLNGRLDWRGGINAGQFLAGIPGLKPVRLPLVMEVKRLSIKPSQHAALMAQQIPLIPRFRRGEEGAGGGYSVSVVINYRDRAEETVRCLASIRAQEFAGEIEIVLINNRSQHESIERITSYAYQIFGKKNVVCIDYDHPFNHSEQSNLGVRAARHSLIFMLSNDSLLISPDALLQGCEIASIPGIASCGFRLIGRVDGKVKLQSLGLAVSSGLNLMQGGSPIVSSIPPEFALDCTFEVVGNSFAATVFRKDVYVALGGLDSQAFPISFNDVDYCLRASAAGYKHVVIGSSIIEHVAHGSRERDLDLPIDMRMVERVPSLMHLVDIGFHLL